MDIFLSPLPLRSRLVLPTNTPQRSFHSSAMATVSPCWPHLIFPLFHYCTDHFVRHDAKEHPAAHGGFVATIILSCASTHFSTTLRSQDQPDLYTAHIEFLAPTALTSASLRVEDLKLGKLTSTVRVELWQSRKGKEQLKAYGSIT